MEAKDRVAEVDRLERGLLLDRGPDPEAAGDYDRIGGNEGEELSLYTASFHEGEENFMKYQMARWALYSLLLILAWGIGLFMLIYLPLRRYILLRDIRSRKLYLTADSIVYRVICSHPILVFVILFYFSGFLHFGWVTSFFSDFIAMLLGIGMNAIF